MNALLLYTPTMTQQETTSQSNWVKIQGKGEWCVYSQEHSFNIHPSLHYEPGAKAETAGIGKVDHGLGEGECKTMRVGLFLGVPAHELQKNILEVHHTNKHDCYI